MTTNTDTSKLSIESIEASKIVPLTKGMYGQEFNRNPIPFYNLRCGQIRGNDLVHNGGWYNNKGEKLGWGDLSSDDLIHLSKTLPEGEVFYILPEGASFWKFVKQIGTLGSDCTTAPTIEAPGMQYVSENCMWVVWRGKILNVDDYVKGVEKKTYKHMEYYQGSRELFLLMNDPAGL